MRPTPILADDAEIADAPSAVVIPLEAMVEREPVTVVCSMKGWVRAIKGHIENEMISNLRKATGTALHCMRRPRISFSSLRQMGGSTPSASTSARGRGHGEPLRLMFDLPQEHDIAGLSIYRPKQKILVAPRTVAVLS